MLRNHYSLVILFVLFAISYADTPPLSTVKAKLEDGNGNPVTTASPLPVVIIGGTQGSASIQTVVVASPIPSQTVTVNNFPTPSPTITAVIENFPTPSPTITVQVANPWPTPTQSVYVVNQPTPSPTITVQVSNPTTTVAVSNLPATQAVSGTFWQSIQPVSGTVAATQSGTWSAGRTWSLLNTTDSVNVGNFPSSQAVTGTFWQSTQPVSGTFWQTTQPVSGTFWQSTQPISAASLPLPAGAATAGGLTTINTTLGSPFQAGGSIGNTSFGISGSLPGFTATPTFNLGTLNGAATAAKQPALGTAGTSSTDVISVQGIASMTPLKVDGSGVTQPVSGTFWPATQPVSGTVATTESGTWTVQPGNTANTTAWLVTGTGGTFPATESGTWNITNISGTVSLPTGASTSSLQTSGNATLTTISGQLPATLGQKAMSASEPIVIASDQGAIPTKAPLSVTGSGSASAATVSTVATLTAPSNAVGFILMNLDTSTANIRWAVGRTASTTLGQQLQPGRDTGFVPIGANVSVIAESGTQNYDIQWVSQ